MASRENEIQTIEKSHTIWQCGTRANYTIHLIFIQYSFFLLAGILTGSRTIFPSSHITGSTQTKFLSGSDHIHRRPNSEESWSSIVPTPGIVKDTIPSSGTSIRVVPPRDQFSISRAMISPHAKFHSMVDLSPSGTSQYGCSPKDIGNTLSL